MRRVLYAAALCVFLAALGSRVVLAQAEGAALELAKQIHNDTEQVALAALEKVRDQMVSNQLGDWQESCRAVVAANEDELSEIVERYARLSVGLYFSRVHEILASELSLQEMEQAIGLDAKAPGQSVNGPMIYVQRIVGDVRWKRLVTLISEAAAESKQAHRDYWVGTIVPELARIDRCLVD